MHLAEANIAWMRAPLTHPSMKEFADALQEINGQADLHDGFVWRLQSEYGNAVDVRAFEDDRILFNLSVWTSMETLFRFTYRSGHGDFFRRRKDWFLPPERDTVVMWWVEEGHRPDVEEAKARLHRLWSQGSSPQAFSFRAPFDATGAPLSPRWRQGLTDD